MDYEYELLLEDFKGDIDYLINDANLRGANVITDAALRNLFKMYEHRCHTDRSRDLIQWFDEVTEERICHYCGGFSLFPLTSHGACSNCSSVIKFQRLRTKGDK